MIVVERINNFIEEQENIPLRKNDIHIKHNVFQNSIDILSMPPESLEKDKVEIILKAREEMKQLNTLDLQVCEISCQKNNIPSASSNLDSAVKDSLSENCDLKDTEKINNEEKSQEDKIQTDSYFIIEQNPSTSPKDQEDNLKSAPNEEVKSALKIETLLKKFIFDESGLKKQARLNRFQTKIVRHVRNASLNNDGNSREEIVCRTMSAREHLETPEMESKRFRNNKVNPSDDSDNGDKADSSLLIGQEKFPESKEKLTSAQQFIGQAMKNLKIKNAQQTKDINKEEAKQNRRQITQKRKTEVILPHSDNDAILPSKQNSFSIMPLPKLCQHVENATLSEFSCPKDQLNELSKMQYRSERSNLQKQPLLQYKSKREDDSEMHTEKIALKNYLNKESPQKVENGEYSLIKKIPLFEPGPSLQEEQSSAIVPRDLVKNTENSQEKMKIPYRLKSLNHNKIIDLGPVHRFNRFQAKPQVPGPQRGRKIGEYPRAVPRTKIPNIDPGQVKRNCTCDGPSQGLYNMHSQHRATPQQIIHPIEPKTYQKYSAMSDKRKPIKKMRPRPKHVVVYNQDSPPIPKQNKPPFSQITSPEEERQTPLNQSQLTTPEHQMARELMVNAHIDWARSMLFWNVKNGIVNFNNDRDSEVFYDFEIDSIENNLKNQKQEALPALHSKARNTLKKLTNELLVGHIFYNFGGLHATPTVANIMAFFSKCRELFKTRKALIPIFILINERDNLVARDIFKLINLSYIEDTQKNYLKSLVSSLHHSTHKILKKVQKFRDDNSLFDEEFVVNRYNYVQVCQVELDDILQIMEKKFGFRPSSSND